MAKRPSPGDSKASGGSTVKRYKPAPHPRDPTPPLHPGVPPPPPGLQFAQATLTLQSYIGYLRNQPKNGTNYSFHEIHQADGGVGIVCKVTLPTNSPIREAVSVICTNQKNAKLSAAFNAVCWLHSAGEIDRNLVPTPSNPSKRSPPPSAKKHAVKETLAAKNQPLPPPPPAVLSLPPPPPTAAPPPLPPPPPAIMDRAQHPLEQARQAARESLSQVPREKEYPFYRHPDFFTKFTPISPNSVFVSVITVEFGSPNQDLTSKCRSLALLTPRPLPFKSTMTLDVGAANVPARAKVQPSEELSIREDLLDHAFEWTRRALRAMTNTPLDGLLEESAYLVLPLTRGGTTAGAISWHEVALVDGPPLDRVPTRSPLFDENMKDALLNCGSKEFAHRVYVERVRHDLTPTSLCPRDERRTILDLVNKNQGQQRHPPRIDDPYQPVLETLQMSAYNRGGLISALATDRHKRYPQHSVPELLRLHFVAASVFRTLTVLPAVMLALEEHLLARQLSDNLFDGKVDPLILRSALVAPSMRAKDNYERLEILGDAVLQFVATASVYSQGLQTIEEMYKKRHLLVSNRALVDIDPVIPGYLRSLVTIGRNYIPPLWTLDEPDGYSPPTKQVLSRKTVADLVEAIIGAIHQSTPAFDDIYSNMQKMGLKFAMPTWSSLKSESPNGVELEEGETYELLGYEFRDPSLGMEVFKFPVGSNMERLVFLGAGLLDFLTMEMLWESNPGLEPGALTLMQHSRVSSAARSSYVAATKKLVDELILSPTDQSRVQSYRAAIQRALTDEHGEREFWVVLPDFRELASVLNALFGAILVDAGFDVAAPRAAFRKHLAPFLSRYGAPPGSQHPKTALFGAMAGMGCKAWSLERVEGAGGFHASVRVHGEEVAAASAGSGHGAIWRACDEALRFKKRIAEICSCRPIG